MVDDLSRLCEIGIVARRLGISVQRVRDLTQQGRLSAIFTLGGRRLYKQIEVERLARERECRTSKTSQS